MSTFNGNEGSETLNSSNWNNSWNVFYMNGGNDSVTTPSTGISYAFYGQYGDDYFMGDTNGDQAYGGANNDRLYGWTGNDMLDGGNDNDHLYGGDGHDLLFGSNGIDHLYGGKNDDYLSGGSGTDYFHINQGESNAINGQADTISDWDVRYDYIDSQIAGTASNYGEMSTTANNIGTARAVVESSGLRNGDHAFLYNPATDTGYLLSDLDHNYTFETGVVINGAGSAADMNWSDIIL